MNDVPLAILLSVALVGALVCLILSWFVHSLRIWRELKTDPPPGLVADQGLYWRAAVSNLVAPGYLARRFVFWFVICLAWTFAALVFWKDQPLALDGPAILYRSLLGTLACIGVWWSVVAVTAWRDLKHDLGAHDRPDAALFLRVAWRNFVNDTGSLLILPMIFAGWLLLVVVLHLF